MLHNGFVWCCGECRNWLQCSVLSHWVPNILEIACERSQACTQHDWQISIESCRDASWQVQTLCMFSLISPSLFILAETYKNQWEPTPSFHFSTDLHYSRARFDWGWSVWLFLACLHAASALLRVSEWMGVEICLLLTPTCTKLLARFPTWGGGGGGK